jgi:hypothetical protein
MPNGGYHYINEKGYGLKKNWLPSSCNCIFSALYIQIKANKRGVRNVYA